MKIKQYSSLKNRIQSLTDRTDLYVYGKKVTVAITGRCGQRPHIEFSEPIPGMPESLMYKMGSNNSGLWGHAGHDEWEGISIHWKKPENPHAVMVPSHLVTPILHGPGEIDLWDWVDLPDLVWVVVHNPEKVGVVYLHEGEVNYTDDLPNLVDWGVEVDQVTYAVALAAIEDREANELPLQYWERMVKHACTEISQDMWGHNVYINSHDYWGNKIQLLNGLEQVKNYLNSQEGDRYSRTAADASQI